MAPTICRSHPDGWEECNREGESLCQCARSVSLCAHTYLREGHRHILEARVAAKHSPREEDGEQEYPSSLLLGCDPLLLEELGSLDEKM